MKDINLEKAVTSEQLETGNWRAMHMGLPKENHDEVVVNQFYWRYF